MPRRTPSSTNLISLADEDAVRDAVWASILGLWKTVNTLTRLRPSRRKAYRVSIFGSARIRPRTKAYTETDAWPKRWRRWAVTSSPAAAPA